MLRTAALMTLLASPALAQEKTFDFKGIDSIDARNGVHVTVVPGDEITVTATARSGDVDKLVIQKFGPWLALNRDTRWLIFPYGRSDEIEVVITLPNLRNIKAFDTATATASGFSGETLRAEALQGGVVSVTDIAYPDVTLYATEGGDLTVTGSCETAVVEAIINASIMSDALTCANVAATTRSGGSIAATASNLASEDSTMGGEITVLGSPELVEYLPGMEPEDDLPTEDAEG